MSTNIFELAARSKLRFTTDRFSSITVEDLFHLSLRDLDNVAKGINRKINAEKEESFLSKNKDTARRDLDLKLDIVKHVISVLETEKEDTLRENEKSRKRQKLIDDIAAAEQRQQETKTPDQLRAELAALEYE